MSDQTFRTLRNGGESNGAAGGKEQKFNVLHGIWILGRKSRLGSIFRKKKSWKNPAGHTVPNPKRLCKAKVNNGCMR